LAPSSNRQSRRPPPRHRLSGNPFAIKKAAPKGPLGEFVGPSGLFHRFLDAFA
jgi:hypothetical protein